jgi:tetratricopeptide (TPR) repeat protein
MLGVLPIVKDSAGPGARVHLERALALRPDSPDYLLHYGLLLAQFGELEQAIAIIEKARKLDSGNPLTHFNLGRLYRQSGNMGKALEELETAVRLRPSLARAYYQLAIMYRQAGELGKAQTAMKKFVELKEQDLIGDPVSDPQPHNPPAAGPTPGR